jgi:hypothetical protein
LCNTVLKWFQNSCPYLYAKKSFLQPLSVFDYKPKTWYWSAGITLSSALFLSLSNLKFCVQLPQFENHSFLWNQFWSKKAWSQSYQTFFLVKQRFFSIFLLLSLIVCSVRKYCQYFEMAKLKGPNLKTSKFGKIDSWTSSIFRHFSLDDSIFDVDANFFNVDVFPTFYYSFNIKCKKPLLNLNNLFLQKGNFVSISIFYIQFNDFDSGFAKMCLAGSLYIFICKMI